MVNIGVATEDLRIAQVVLVDMVSFKALFLFGEPEGGSVVERHLELRNFFH